MADITVSYKGATIAEVSASGTTTLETAGKYCEDDISIAYVQPNPSSATDITITYGESTIAEVSTSGTTTLGTKGKYCTSNILLEYVRPSIQIITDDSIYLFRQLPYNSNAKTMQKIVGCSFAWNQIAQFPNRTNITSKGITFSIADGICTYSGTPTASTGYVDLASGTFSNFTAGHKYLIRVVDSNGGVSRKCYVVINNPYAEIPSSESNAKRYAIYAPTATPTYFLWRLSLVNLATDTQISGTAWVQAFDLTMMFGSTIANYIYGLGASACLAWFQNLFGKDYYPYDSGTLMSVKTSASTMVGFNQLSPTSFKYGASSVYNIAVGNTLNVADTSANVSVSSGNPITITNTTNYRGALFYLNHLIPNGTYYLQHRITASSDNSKVKRTYYTLDSDFKVIRKIENIASVSQTESYVYSKTITLENGESIIALAIESATQQTITVYDLCISLASGSYQPYASSEYPIDNIELRGLPKLVNNALVYDGDEYEPDGTVKRKYGIVDLGALSWTKRNTSTGHWRFTTQDIPIKWNSASDAVGNMVCSRYQSVSASNTWNGITGISSHTTMTQLLVCDESYSDAAVFKTAMSGVYLIYELATPTTESATAYTARQTCYPNGTEQFVDGRTVEVPVNAVADYEVTL